MWLHSQEGGAHAKTKVADIKNIEPGCMPLPAKLAVGLMTGAGVTGEETVTLKKVERGLQMKFGGLKATLDKADVEVDLSPMDLKSEVHVGTFLGKDVRDALQSVVAFAAVKDVRMYLCGVALFVQNGKLVFVASDGHRIAELVSDLPSEISDFGDDVLIPECYASSLVSVIDPDKNITISMVGVGSSRNIRFTSEDFVLTTTLYGGKFPNYQVAIKQMGVPDTNPTVDRKTVVSAIKRISLISDSIVFCFDPDEGRVAIKSSDGESIEHVDATYSEGAKACSMAYNPVKLGSSIDEATTEQVVLSVDSNAAPQAMIQILRTDDVQWRGFLMPMRS